MAALVQTFPQQTGTVTMLQARPTSASGIISPQGQPSQYAPQQQRHSYYGGPNNMVSAPVLYRASSAPIQPYAFTSTPNLNQNTHRQQQQQQQQQQTQPGNARPPSTMRQSSNGSVNNVPSGSGVRYSGGAYDDSSLPTPGTRRVAITPRPQSAAYLAGSTSVSHVPHSQTGPVRVSPERYRRSVPRTLPDSALPAQGHSRLPSQSSSAAPSGSGMASIGHLYGARSGSSSNLPDPHQRLAQQPGMRRNSLQGLAMPGTAVDDIQLHRQQWSDEAKRFRRRSMPSLDSVNFQVPLTSGKQSDDSSPASRSSGSRSPDKEKRPKTTGGDASSISTASNASASVSVAVAGAVENKDSPKLVVIPPRGSSDATARLGSNPTSTAKPAASNESTHGNNKTTAGTTTAGPSFAGTSQPLPAKQPTAAKGLPSHLESPAMRHLSAINQKGGKMRSKTSRLRRAFSFGSVADFEHITTISEEPTVGADGSAPNKLQKEPTSEELYDAEQARIAQRQEEAGIGNSIYAGARIFTGSTDNLSISSTASSASIMIRKMGRGMKKGTRSLVGLFRPKSMANLRQDGNVSDATLATSTNTAEATVSMVTVEAERERVNVNADLHAKAAGGTGFPRLERNSIDASRTSTLSERVGSSGTDHSASRKSIVGGEKERAEVLAAVRKGILKHSNGSSDNRNTALDMPLPTPFNDSPASSAPSTPNDEAQGHRRTGSLAIGNEDYFVSALRLRQDSRSSGSTPRGSMRRNATFSPRIVFHDTWPSQEYDRRGEIATCNRLTPMLAQQIKEELNSFKMEMEVHENSKIYTHFF